MPGGAGVGWGSRFSPPAPLSPVKVNRASLPFPGLENIRSGLGGGEDEGQGSSLEVQVPTAAAEQQTPKPEPPRCSCLCSRASHQGPRARDPKASAPLAGRTAGACPTNKHTSTSRRQVPEPGVLPQPRPPPDQALTARPSSPTLGDTPPAQPSPSLQAGPGWPPSGKA